MRTIGTARSHHPLIPANAGTQIIWHDSQTMFRLTWRRSRLVIWIPAYAGMSGV
jgi:hypothetical protein